MIQRLLLVAISTGAILPAMTPNASAKSCGYANYSGVPFAAILPRGTNCHTARKVARRWARLDLARAQAGKRHCDDRGQLCEVTVAYDLWRCRGVRPRVGASAAKCRSNGRTVRLEVSGDL
jgi:hypothetical protein